jgi:glycosyltransferase
MINRDIFVIDEKSIGSEYGIGTYLNEYIKCLKSFDFNIYIINLFSDEPLIQIYKKEDVTYILIPRTNTPNITLKSYYHSVCVLLGLYVKVNNSPIFQLSFHESSNFVDFIREYFESSVILYTIHYSCWSLQLNSDFVLFENIIQKNNTGAKLSEIEHHVVKDFIKEKELFQKVDKIICLSEETKNTLLNIYSIENSKLAMIPNGLEDTYKPKELDEKYELKKKYGLNVNEKIILYVGRLTAMKGVYALLDSFKKIIQTQPDCRLFLVGEGDFTRVLAHCKDIWAKITITGKLSKEELSQLYKITDIGVIPSYNEQCSYVSLEMMMNCIPCVVSDAMGLNSIFTNRQNALIAEIGNFNKNEHYISNLTKAILQLIESDNLKEMISQKNRNVFLRNYNLDVMKKNYKVLFSSF